MLTGDGIALVNVLREIVVCGDGTQLPKLNYKKKKAPTSTSTRTSSSNVDRLPRPAGPKIGCCAILASLGKVLSWATSPFDRYANEEHDGSFIRPGPISISSTRD